MSTELSDGLAFWLSWKRVNEMTRTRILADIVAQSPLTEPEFTVLAHLDEHGGSMRQNALATAAGWDRTRLSHLLTRMEERRYLTRERLKNGVELTVLTAGQEAFAATREPLERAVEHWFTGRLTPEQLSVLATVNEALAR